MSSQTDTRELEPDVYLGKIIQAIVLAVQPDRILLFGSRIEGKAAPDSDYDLLILKNGFSNERDISRLAYFSLFEHGITAPVDILVADDERIQRARSRKGDVLIKALSEGRPIYERV